MTQVLLFHSVLGLRPAVVAFADRLRAAGHEVSTPDLWDGELFDAYEPGIEKLDALGDEVTERAAAALAELGDAPVVLGGFSAGAWLAEYLAGRHEPARAAILMHDAQPPAAVELDRWPGSVALQVHAAQGDPWFDWDQARALERAALDAGAGFELHSYPGDGHVFGDEGMPGHDPAATELMTGRVLDLLARVG